MAKTKFQKELDLFTRKLLNVGSFNAIFVYQSKQPEAKIYLLSVDCMRDIKKYPNQYHQIAKKYILDFKSILDNITHRDDVVRFLIYNHKILSLIINIE